MTINIKSGRKYQSFTKILLADVKTMVEVSKATEWKIRVITNDGARLCHKGSSFGSSFYVEFEA